MAEPALVPVVLVCNEEYWLPYVLKAARPHFERFVIYDVGSTDHTRSVIEWFRDTSPGLDIWYRSLPMVHPSAQGAFRNSMIVEARSPHYFILDGDEIYTDQCYEALKTLPKRMEVLGRTYGVVARSEWTSDLRMRYGAEQRTPHHRVYSRDAIWTGTHPGERPFIPLGPARELLDMEIVCHHFHHAARSPQDAATPGRFSRKDNATYHRGVAIEADLLSTLPVLEKPIESFPVCPALAEIQNAMSQMHK